jgi:hypothetical protein
MRTAAPPDISSTSAGILVEQLSQKSPTRQAERKNRSQDAVKNHPQDGSKNRPDIINPVSLLGVIDESGLKGLLKANKQATWCSRVRVCGLLLLIDYISRNQKKGTISISADLARQYISKLRKKDRPTTITEPLLLLCEIGMLRRVRPAVFAHIKAPAGYCFAGPYSKESFQLKVFLTPKLAQKRAFAVDRCEKRLNRNYPWRARLSVDLHAIRFSDSARRIIANDLSSKRSENLKQLVRAVDAGVHFIKVSARGQITTSISNCPRDLHPHLLLYGEPIVFCDISHAHWNFLPLILAKRLDHVSGSPGRHTYINDGWREHNHLVALLSDGDFYRMWCVDPKDNTERNEKKNILNILLNSKNDVCERNILYQRIRTEFPITFRTIEDLKSRDHRNLSKQLHRFTADAIEAALLEVQKAQITAIPNIDALICRHKDRKAVCESIGKQIFLATGACSKVGGIRYSPLTEIEEQALAFDETAVTDDTISYDEWEAIRLVKCVAALKLMRRTPPLFAPFALAAWRVP